MSFESLIFSKAVWIFFAFIALFGAERAFPMVALRGGLQRVAKNLSLAAVNAILSPLIVIPITAFAAAHALHWRPEGWDGIGPMLVDLLLLDCWIYFWHRINHVVPVLWRFHEIHHLDETLDTSSGLRFHFGEVFLSSIVRAIVIFLLGVPLATVVVFEVAVSLMALFQHSNVKLPRWLEQQLSKIIVTPSIHWVHHHALRRDTDSNYSNFFSIWDHVFGTASTTQRSAEMPIGVEGAKDKTLTRLVMRPFRVTNR
jgi:sterol desaturase/sphingolipid hydroxylase (fatty acid hydroxylase superfamily)